MAQRLVTTIIREITNYKWYKLPIINDTKWYEHISNTEELLEKAITRSILNLIKKSLSKGLKLLKRKNQ